MTPDERRRRMLRLRRRIYLADILTWRDRFFRALEQTPAAEGEREAELERITGRFGAKPTPSDFCAIEARHAVPHPGLVAGSRPTAHPKIPASTSSSFSQAMRNCTKA